MCPMIWKWIIRITVRWSEKRSYRSSVRWSENLSGPRSGGLHYVGCGLISLINRLAGARSSAAYHGSMLRVWRRSPRHPRLRRLFTFFGVIFLLKPLRGSDVLITRSRHTVIIVAISTLLRIRSSQRAAHFFFFLFLFTLPFAHVCVRVFFL